MELFARSPKKSLPFALAIGYWRWEGKKDPYIYKVYRGARKSASFFCLVLLLRLPSLFLALYLASKHRPTTERTPTQLPMSKKCVLLRFPFFKP